MCRKKEGTSSVLLQSGEDEKWWVDSMGCQRYLRNVQDPLADGKTTHEGRFGEPLKGPTIPLGQWTGGIWMALLKERHAEERKEHLLYCYILASMKNGELILWNVVVAFCEMSKTSWQNGKHPCERRLGEPFRGQVVPFGAMVEYRPISARDQSKLHQFGKNFTWNIPRICIDRRGDFGKEMFWLRSYTLRWILTFPHI